MGKEVPSLEYRYVPPSTSTLLSTCRYLHLHCHPRKAPRVKRGTPTQKPPLIWPRPLSQRCLRYGPHLDNVALSVRGQVDARCEQFGESEWLSGYGTGGGAILVLVWAVGLVGYRSTFKVEVREQYKHCTSTVQHSTAQREGALPMNTGI
ncbi:hypothetical protein HOY80DRAFT_993452 [Tuber brumale]|nr:hypothetical protein HOY80DRAFT_993452 [Tuber brumale]